MRSIVLTLVFVLAVSVSADAQQAAPEVSSTPEPAPAEGAPPAAEPEAEPAAPEPVPAPVEPAPAPAPAAPAPPPPLMLQVGELTLRPRIQARMRYEGRINPYGNGVGLSDQHFVTTRARIGFDARWHAVRIVTEVQDVRDFGTFPGADDGSRFALHQGFIEVGSETAYIRAGRQEVAIGEERFVGPLDWLMAARSFDAIRVHLGSGALTFDGFGAMVRPRATHSYTNNGMPATVLSRGDYFAFAQLAVRTSDSFTFEGYTLYRHDGPIATEPTRDRDIVAPGVRLVGKATERLTLTTELQTQLGQTGGENHVALAAVADARYALAGSLHPTLNVGFNYATGNHGDQHLDEVDNFFPTNHKFYGNADLIGLRNVIEGHANVSFRPEGIPVTLFGGARVYGLEDPAARWTNAGGVPLGVSQSNEDRFLGTELDATFAWTAHERLVLSGGYSVFVPGSGAENLGHGDVQHWFYLMLGADTQ